MNLFWNRATPHWRKSILIKSAFLKTMFFTEPSHMLEITTEGDDTDFFHCQLSPSHIATFAHISRDCFFATFAGVKDLSLFFAHAVSKIVMFFIVAFMAQPFDNQRLGIVHMMGICKAFLETAKAIWISNKSSISQQVGNLHSGFNFEEILHA